MFVREKFLRFQWTTDDNNLPKINIFQLFPSESKSCNSTIAKKYYVHEHLLIHSFTHTNNSIKLNAEMSIFFLMTSSIVCIIARAIAFHFPKMFFIVYLGFQILRKSNFPSIISQTIFTNQFSRIVHLEVWATNKSCLGVCVCLFNRKCIHNFDENHFNFWHFPTKTDKLLHLLVQVCISYEPIHTHKHKHNMLLWIIRSIIFCAKTNIEYNAWVIWAFRKFYL